MSMPSELVTSLPLAEVLDYDLTKRQALLLLDEARAWRERRADIIRAALAAGVNKSEAARRLGIGRDTVHEWLRNSAETPAVVS